MSARRFWSMEKQISRIEAERDLRVLQINSSAQSKEAVQELNEHLSSLIGDKYRLKHEVLVAPKAGDRERMKHLMKQQLKGLK